MRIWVCMQCSREVRDVGAIYGRWLAVTVSVPPLVRMRLAVVVGTEALRFLCPARLFRLAWMAEWFRARVCTPGCIRFGRNEIKLMILFH
jgi:hypothetical protein